MSDSGPASRLALDDDLRELTLIDWGPHPGRVISALRGHLHLSLGEIQELRALEKPVVARGSARDLWSLQVALDQAGAEVETILSEEA